MLNYRYGKLVDGRLKNAPRMFKDGASMVVLKADDDDAYLARGWLKIADNQPDDFDQKLQYATLSGYIELPDEGLLSAVYEVKDVTVVHKDVAKYSKLKMVLFLTKQGIWSTVKQFLEQAGYYDLFVMAQYFLENDQHFVAGIQAFKDAFKDEIDDIDSICQQMLDAAYDGSETVTMNRSELASDD